MIKANTKAGKYSCSKSLLADNRNNIKTPAGSIGAPRKIL
jgi:hypothetical protein